MTQDYELDDLSLHKCETRIYITTVSLHIFPTASRENKIFLQLFLFIYWINKPNKLFYDLTEINLSEQPW